MSESEPTAEVVESVAAAAAIIAELRQFNSRLMAGYEAAHRRLLDGYDAVSARLNSSEGAMTRALELQLKMTEEYERLLSLRHERELRAESARARSEALGQITRDVRALAPVVAKKLLGVPLTGNDSHGLQDLLASLDADQLDSIMTSGKLELSEAQRQALAATLGSLAQKEASDAAAE